MLEIIVQEQLHQLILAVSALFAVLVFTNLVREFPTELHYLLLNGKVVNAPNPAEDAYALPKSVRGQFSVLFFALRHGANIKFLRRVSIATIESFLTLLFVPNPAMYGYDGGFAAVWCEPLGHQRIDWLRVSWANRWWPWKTARTMRSLSEQKNTVTWYAIKYKQF